MHLSNARRREDFRQVDIVAGACVGVISEFGWRSYILALDVLGTGAQADPEGS